MQEYKLKFKDEIDHEYFKLEEEYEDLILATRKQKLKDKIDKIKYEQALIKMDAPKVEALQKFFRTGPYNNGVPFDQVTDIFLPFFFKLVKYTVIFIIILLVLAVL